MSKIGVQQSTLWYNLNHYKNKQLFNKEAQNGIMTKHISNKTRINKFTIVQ